MEKYKVRSFSIPLKISGTESEKNIHISLRWHSGIEIMQVKN